ncbi:MULTISPECIES: hypothetical protein [Cyanophyceae]|uniref:hypothetical protein n=1 Tax=Cyanophyceae TaxID=3028117 RepID=UPI0023304597|nr:MULTISPECIES: hypothetical protein [Cyanophyceae]MDB9356315.1 hypothetical protein [Nodularia spumigena CS-587/03]MDB9337764.1 hypothetical protein [Nodularia spumigena CS-589/07]MDB9347331.1 hypothetical protein [Nodularia spumigena CS-588/01]MDB9352600.1 hypothetical protein [Nodularia spumigena CS-588/05]MDB9360720.1 hypothetical protein [Nodularia spumigena CS-588/02]
MGRKPKLSLVQLIKKWGTIATVFALPFLGLMVMRSECGGVLHVKRTNDGFELLVDKRNCKAPTIVDTPGKPLALDHTNDSTETKQPQVD